MSLKKRLLRAFIVYVLDMTAAITGWIYGFGMEVKNWYALIVIMLVLRFVFFILSVCAYVDDAKAIGSQQ